MLWVEYCWFMILYVSNLQDSVFANESKNHRTMKVKQSERKSLSGGCDLGNEHQISEANSKVIQFLLNITDLCYPSRSNEMTGY